MPKKTYVLDASVLLSAGRKALFAFEEHRIIIPISVIQMLEDRKADSQLGFTARSVLKEIEKLRGQNVGELGDISKGVPLNKKGGKLVVELNHTSLQDIKEAGHVRIDNDEKALRVLAVAYYFQNMENENVVLVSNSLPLRIKAKALGVEAEEFYGNRLQTQGYSGYYDQVGVPTSVIDSIYKSGEQGVTVAAKYFKELGDHPINFGAHFTDGKNKVLGLVESQGKDGNTVYTVTRCSYKKDYGNSRFTPGSPEQYIAADYISSDNDVQIISIGGAAGTGKTALTLAVGFEQVVENMPFQKKDRDMDELSKVIVFRPMNPVGSQEYGFLPGNEEEKMDPWAAAVYDALRASTDKHTMEEVKGQKLLEVLPVTHIRGRTFDNSLIIVDEAQNLESIVLLSVMSRAGKNSKVVFLWDANQRDNLNISKDDGIVNIVEYFKNTPEFVHIELTKSERSVISELANDAIEGLGI